MAYFNKKGKLMPSDSYSPGTKSFEVEDTYTPYMKKKFEDELEAIRKFQAEAAEANREEVVDDSQHTPMANPFSPMSDEMRNSLREQVEAKYSATNDSEDYNIDHLLVGTPSNPFDQEKERLKAVEENRKKFVSAPFDPAALASEYNDSIEKLDSRQVVKEVTDRRLKEEQYDRDYKEGLARWDAMNKKVATPVFKVGEMIHNTKGAMGQGDFDMFKGEDLSLSEMMEVINSGNTTSVDLSDPQVVAPIEATKQRNFGLDDGLTAIERQVNKINANSKVDLNKPPWIQGRVDLIPAGKNVNKNTHNISLGANLNMPFDSFDKNNVTEDKDLYQMLQELEGNWK